MKTLKQLSILALALVLLSCLEEVPVDNNNFIKIYGKESGSFGSSLYEYPNGNVLIGGKVDVPALDFTNVGGDFNIGKIVEGSIALIDIDANGNQRALHSLPIAAHPTVPQIQFPNIEDKGRVNEILPTSDGGYMLLCEWRGIDVLFPEDSIEIPGSNGTTAPFLVKLNNQFYPEFVRSFNGEPDWDGVIRSSAKMKALPDGNIGFLFGSNYYDLTPGGALKGYSFLSLDQKGDTVFFRDFYDDRFDIKAANDFILDNNGWLTMIGQVNTSLWIIVQRGQEFGQELSAYFDESGQGDAHNNNPMFIEQFSDGEYLVVYTDPPQDTRMQIFGLCDVNCPPQNPDTGPIIISQEVREFPRAVTITKNDEILIYTERLTNSTVPEGYLYRVDKMGNTKFRIRLEGTPGDVIESQDGTILVLSNPLFNGLIPKTRLTKLSADGTIF